MFEINPSNARQWSRIGSRGVFGQAILAVAEHHPNMIAVSADLGNSSGLDRFKKAYPEQFLNIGIAEQNMIGVAAGMAKEGYNVFATSFAPFIAMRASEQVRMNLGYMGMNVKAVAIGSGVSMAFLGNSHYGIEDMAVMRAIPNLTVVCPADCAEIFKTVQAAARFDGPMYIRLTGAVGNPPVYTADYSFEIGKAVTLREPGDVTFIATGSMVHESLEAAKLLEQTGVSAGVINMHTIKPLDVAALGTALERAKLLVTVEEHSVIGGLGSAVAEYKAAKRQAPPQLILGLPDAFDVTGDYRFLLERHGLVAAKIAEKVQTALNS
ncbi:transketolase family protein [Chromobacterium haemolyticum]|uniref:Transketolase family protein n=1 Tax=Chromobacterium haemolyticum TaxID=394935 RepID=A0ABS3GTI3_9NEIS|nr:transketolase C-terminal domain-containing protein [Chromobacterium haemolyticum]MBK0417254.1 transketolase family protein [Chromobacterium haemolyticum]MBO0418365.1 transketolase family protein [Chromobacterium haemolyticum]MBO0501704.1 transketolase family protein [Chromobacterium haemolyticum]BBH14701.1 transketolase [Chromobacterium haemolyticum]